MEDADTLGPKRLDEYQNLITGDGPHTFFLPALDAWGIGGMGQLRCHNQTPK